MRKESLENAIGMRLAHDITEVNPEADKKFCAFKRGHIVTERDLEHLRRLGKHSLYVQDDSSEEMHEDEAAKSVAPLAAGDNIRFDAEPTEGKVGFYATCDGVFVVDAERLYQINSLEIPSFPTIHTNYPVREGTRVAAFRIIPLTCKPSLIRQVHAILSEPLFRVEPYMLETAGIVATGNELYEGLIEDSFTEKLTEMLGDFGVRVTEATILPDEHRRISETVKRFSEDCDIVLITGGTSVDPDDVTLQAMSSAGVSYEVHGAPIQPGNNFTIGYRDGVPVCAVPAAALYYKSTSLNVFLPRLLAGQKVSKEDVYRAGHGGLCHFCEKCHFPCCPFAVQG